MTLRLCIYVYVQSFSCMCCIYVRTYSNYRVRYGSQAWKRGMERILSNRSGTGVRNWNMEWVWSRPSSGASIL